jgi:hypothetical protein
MNAHGSIPALRENSRATFLGGVAVAAVLAAAGAAIFSATFNWWSPRFAIRLVVALVGGAYVLYLLARSDERTGRVVTVAVWSVAAALLAAFANALPLFLIGHAVLVWLVRALYHQRSTIGALADLGLTALALAAAVAAMRSTGSLFIAIWSFFLIEALFAAIPNVPVRPHASEAVEPFERAQHGANAALRRLASQRAP